MVGFLPDYRLGRCISRLFNDRRSSGWNSENPVWGVPGPVPHLAIPWTASCLRPDNVRVALDVETFRQNQRHSNYINNCFGARSSAGYPCFLREQAL